MASMRNDFFQGQMDRDLIYWPNHSEETLLSRKKTNKKTIDQQLNYLYNFMQVLCFKYLF